MEQLCLNADCDNHLTSFELKALGVNNALRSKKRFCSTCRRYKLNNIQRLRCTKCSEGFAIGNSIFQSVCNNCQTQRMVTA